jgi:isochorismate synthase
MDLSRDGVLFEGEPDSISDSGAHKERVEKAIGFIRSGKASKIVVSRLEVIKGRVYDTLALFFDICRNYPFAFAYLFSHPVSGTWMGATPETLLNLSNGVFQTMALAATRPYRGSLDIAWNSKELEEQRLVETFIQEQLDPITDHLESDDSRSSRAGNLVHIQTPIRGRLNAAHSISDLIRVLHPTPAVCGTPRPAAAAYIKENENYDRAYYTGYLGEVNGPGQAVLFVNLRCMRVMDDRVYLYVGGGITGESEPGQEWEETVQKSMTMKRLLFRKV